MKSFIRMSPLGLGILSLLLLFSGCPTGSSSPAITGITIVTAESTIKTGETLNIEIILEPGNADPLDLTWSSTNPGIGSVNAQLQFTGLTVGETEISASAGGGYESNSVRIIVLPADQQERMVRLKFNFTPEESGSEDGEGEYYFVTRNSNPGSKESTLTPLVNGENEVNLPAGRIHLADIVRLPAVASSSSGRSIAGAFSRLGGIKIITANLDSLPIGDTPEEELELGSLTYNSLEESFEAEPALESVSADVGITKESLEPFGNYDQILSKYSNLDIDSSGTLDTEENLHWNFKSIYNFFIHPGDIGFHTNEVFLAPEDIAPNEFQYCFIRYDFADYTAYSLEPDFKPLLTLPAASTDLSTIESNGGMGNYRNGISEWWSYFTVSSSEAGGHPFDGSYEADFGSSVHFSIDDIQFIKPESGYEGFLIPLLDVNINNSSEIQSFSLHWKKVREGRYEDTLSEEVGLKVRSLTIALPHFENNELIMYHQEKGFEENTWLRYEGDTVPYSYLMQYFDPVIYNGTESVNLGVSYDAGGHFSMAGEGLSLQDNSYITVMYEDVAGNNYIFDVYNTNYLIEDYTLPNITATTTAAPFLLPIPTPSPVRNLTTAASTARLYLISEDTDGRVSASSAPLLSSGSPGEWTEGEEIGFVDFPADSVVLGDKLFICYQKDSHSIIMWGEISPIDGSITDWNGNIVLQDVQYPAMTAAGNRLIVADTAVSRKIWTLDIDTDGVPGIPRETADLSPFYILSWASDIAASEDHIYLAAGKVSSLGTIGSIVLTGNIEADGTISNLRHTSNLPQEGLRNPRLEMINGNLFLFGGGRISETTGTSLFNRIAVVKPASDGSLGGWKRLSPLSIPTHTSYSVTLSGNSVYISGGVKSYSTPDATPHVEVIGVSFN